MEQKLLNALVAHYNAKIQSAEANLLAYFKNPTGVGEHPDLVAEMVKLVDNVNNARGALQVLNDMVQQAPVPEAPEAPVEGE
jgi:hypothetical protein